MSMLSELFGGGKKNGANTPMNSANQYLNQIPGVGHQAYDDYISQGKTSGTNTHNQYENLLNDPQGFINKIMEGYKPSESYQYQKDKLGTSMSNTAAAGGIAGTPLDQMNQGEQLQKLLSGDQQQWLSNVLGEYHKGLEGEQGEATQGYNASGSLADILGGSLNQQGGLAFNQSQQEKQDRNTMIQQLIKALGGAAGFAFGGPAGGALGAGMAGPTSGTPKSPWSNPG